MVFYHWNTKSHSSGDYNGSKEIRYIGSRRVNDSSGSSCCLQWKDQKRIHISSAEGDCTCPKNIDIARKVDRFFSDLDNMEEQKEQAEAFGRVANRRGAEW